MTYWTAQETTQYSVLTYMKKNLKKNGYMHIINWITAIHLKLTQHCKSAISQYKIKIKFKNCERKRAGNNGNDGNNQ